MFSALSAPPINESPKYLHPNAVRFHWATRTFRLYAVSDRVYPFAIHMEEFVPTMWEHLHKLRMMFNGPVAAMTRQIQYIFAQKVMSAKIFPAACARLEDLLGPDVVHVVEEWIGESIVGNGLMRPFQPLSYVSVYSQCVLANVYFYFGAIAGLQLNACPSTVVPPYNRVCIGCKRVWITEFHTVLLAYGTSVHVTEFCDTCIDALSLRDRIVKHRGLHFRYPPYPITYDTSVGLCTGTMICND